MKQSFAPIDKVAWYQKIKQDLKGRNPEELEWSVNERISISPFIHGEDALPHMQTSLYSHPSPPIKNDWKIIENFALDTPIELSNKRMLEALSHGVQGIQFPSVWMHDIQVIDQLLKGVDLSMISLYITAENADKVIELVTKYKDTIHFSEGTFFQNGGFEWTDIPNQNQVQKYVHKIIKTPIFTDFTRWQLICISSVEQRQSTSQLQDILIQLTTWAEVVEDLGLDFQTWYERSTLKIYMGESYFENIATIRALKILLANWEMMYFSKNVKTPLLRSVIDGNREGIDVNIALIPSTWKVMSAAIGGVNEIHIPNGNSKENYRDTQRNIHHLMRDESKLDLVIDPAAGSYWLEGLTTKIAKQSWKQFYDKMKSTQKNNI